MEKDIVMPRTLTALIFGLMISLTGSLASAQQLSLDDFVPPAQGGSTQVKEDVVEEEGVIKSKTAQDGLNHAYQSLMDEGEEGVRHVIVPSGQAIISVAHGLYTVYDNRNATLLSKRSAYVKAMLKAQKAMLENMNGSVNTCIKGVREELLTIDTGSDENQTNSSEVVVEGCNEQVEGLIRGCVLFSVEDRPDEKTVVVAMASSTKTRGAVDQLGGAVIRTTDPKKAWQAVVNQITNGVVPPLGTRLITNPETGENIVIGFGSAIVRKNRSAKVAAKLAKVAKKQARLRSRNALLSFLKGEAVYWSGTFAEAQLESEEQFEVLGPGEGPSAETGARAFDESRDIFMNGLKTSDDYVAVTSGRVPPGVKTKVFLDKTGDWAIAVAVYSKSMEQQAKQAAKESGDSSGTGSDGKPRSGRTIKVEGGVNDQASNPAGPSGQVTSEIEL